MEILGTTLDNILYTTVTLVDNAAASKYEVDPSLTKLQAAVRGLYGPDTKKVFTELLFTFPRTKLEWGFWVGSPGIVRDALANRTPQDNLDPRHHSTIAIAFAQGEGYALHRGFGLELDPDYVAWQEWRLKHLGDKSFPYFNERRLEDHTLYANESLEPGADVGSKVRRVVVGQALPNPDNHEFRFAYRTRFA